MRDDDFKLLRGFANKQMNGQMDSICDCRAAFATDNLLCYSLAIAELEQFKLDYDGTCTCPTGLNK